MADEITNPTEGAGAAPAQTPTTTPETPAAGAAAAGEGGAAPAGESQATPAAGDKAAPPAEGKTDGETKKADDGKAADAPIDYASLKMPEGYKTDDPVFQDAVKLFGDEKLSPETAQKLLDFTVERDKALAKAVNDANADAWTKQSDKWKAETEKEFSAEDLGGARKVAEKIFDTETLKYLEGLKFTNHPGFVRALVKVSKAISEDTWVPGNAAANGSRDARSFYSNSNMNP